MVASGVLLNGAPSTYHAASARLTAGCPQSAATALPPLARRRCHAPSSSLCSGLVRPSARRANTALQSASDSSRSYNVGGGGGRATSEPEQQQLQRLASNTTASGSKLAVLRASKTASHPVEESDRPIAEYMALPASQYSVLDAKRIERVGDSTFVCYVGGIQFLNLVVEPVLTVSVDVGERGPTVRLLSTKLQGSKFVTAANDRFDATMTNAVRWRDQPHALGKEITSETTIQVVVEVPRWAGFVPVPAIEASGSSVLQGVLNSMVPRFLAQLEMDYYQWAGGNSARKPVGDGMI